ncbi:DUF503 domain-containing protein [Chloroflexota bacterium]
MTPLWRSDRLEIGSLVAEASQRYVGCGHITFKGIFYRSIKPLALVMNVGICKIFLRLPENLSLKGKRQELKSIISRIRNKFNVSVAEIDNHDMWQLATIGICCVSNDSRYTNRVLSKVVDLVTGGRFEIEILDYEIEIIAI